MNASTKTKESADSNVHDDLQHPPKEEVIEHIPAEKLKSESRARAKKQPIIQRIARALSPQKHEPYRELIINAEPLETRVALLVDGVLDKFEVERTGEARMVGAIFKGKIQNLENGLKAAFVDIGQPKNAFLHYWDIIPGAQEDNSIEFVRDTRSEEKRGKKVEKPNLKEIPKMFPIGTEIILQITKGQIGSRARVLQPTSPCPAASSCSCPTRASAASPAKSTTRKSAPASNTSSAA